MDYQDEQRLIKHVKRIADALERIAKQLEDPKPKPAVTITCATGGADDARS